MIGTLILIFIGSMAMAVLGLFSLVRLGVVDQQLSLILFVAAVPMAAWIALNIEAVEPGGMGFPPGERAVPTAQINIGGLWPPGFDEVAPTAPQRLRDSAVQNAAATAPAAQTGPEAIP